MTYDRNSTSLRYFFSLSFAVLVLIAVAAAVSVASGPSLDVVDDPPDKQWYKGNTHAHTVLSGHADSSPDHVAAWYHDLDYNFLILSEHNIFIDPDSVNLPAGRRDDFILIPGEEVTGQKVIHTTAMNVRGLVNWHTDHEHKHEIIQSHVDSTIDAGGTPILNHPNFRWAVSADDMLPVERLHLFELYNGHPHVQNFGDHAHPSTEEIWDDLLTRGMLIYGISSDDAHDFQRWDETYSNPGRGWVMVHADELTPNAVTQAMRRGDFYATSGVRLSAVERGTDVYRVAVDVAATDEELRSPYLIGHRVDNTQLEQGGEYEISFIGEQGDVLKVVKGVVASYPVSSDQSYVRAKITYRRPAEEDGVEAYYAWTQPVFTDDRAEAATALGRL